ncbi:MAG: hypothetical protein MMC33_010492, partial [Icmadophila ericetorum]|nr:hypothetical protein [Icmadophila ericetorum]
MAGLLRETSVGACPEPIIDHQHAIEKDINSLLSRIEQAKSPTVNKEPVKAFILSIQNFLRKQQSASSHAEIIIKLNRIEESTRTTTARVGQLTANVESISSASTTSTHKGQHSSLVLALGSRAKRDEIVAKNRLYWQDTPHQVEKYDLALRILQCLKCCKYGHTIAQCRSPTP